MATLTMARLSMATLAMTTLTMATLTMATLTMAHSLWRRLPWATHFYHGEATLTAALHLPRLSEQAARSERLSKAGRTDEASYLGLGWLQGVR